MFAYPKVSAATCNAWRGPQHAIARRHNNKSNASGSHSWAYCHSLNLWAAVAQPRSPPRLRSRGTASALCSDGEQLTSDEYPHASQTSPASSSPFTILRIEASGKNRRRILAAIPIEAPLDVLWSALTDYERLADFIPSLAVCKVEDRWENGARLFQIGEQNLAFGLKFKAKGVLNVQEFPVEVLSHGICRRIDFEMVEGDFQIFKGTWQMEQESNDNLETTDDAAAAAVRRETVLTYIVDVQPKIWLSVRLVEGILSKEIQNNLVSIRDHVKNIHPSLPA